MKMKQMFLIALMFAAPLARAAATGSTTADLDTRDYTLAVTSAHGTPVPATGTNTYAWRSTVTASVDTASGGYTCTGWSGIGSIPATGTTNTTGAITLTTLASSIAWAWQADVTDTSQYEVAERFSANLATGFSHGKHSLVEDADGILHFTYINDHDLHYLRYNPITHVYTNDLFASVPKSSSTTSMSVVDPDNVYILSQTQSRNGYDTRVDADIYHFQYRKLVRSVEVLNNIASENNPPHDTITTCNQLLKTPDGRLLIFGNEGGWFGYGHQLYGRLLDTATMSLGGQFGVSTLVGSIDCSRNTAQGAFVMPDGGITVAVADWDSVCYSRIASCSASDYTAWSVSAPQFDGATDKCVLSACRDHEGHVHSVYMKATSPQNQLFYAVDGQNPELVTTVEGAAYLYAADLYLDGPRVLIAFQPLNGSLSLAIKINDEWSLQGPILEQNTATHMQPTFVRSQTDGNECATPFLAVIHDALGGRQVKILELKATSSTTHLVTLHPGDHGSIANANSGVDYVTNVVDGAAFPAVTVNASAGWSFTGWNPAAPATVTSDFEATAVYAAVLRPDLSLTATDLRILNASGVETYNPATNETVTVEVTVHNTGDAATSGNILVQLFLDGAPTDLTSYASNDFVVAASAVVAESIAVGVSRTLLIPWTLTGPDRVATLTAVAEFASNRAQSQANSQGASGALSITEASLDNNATGRSLQIGSPAAGKFGIDVNCTPPVNMLSGVRYTLAGTAHYDWGTKGPVLGALATVTVNGVTYTDRTVPPDGAWSVSLNGLPVSNHVAHIVVSDGGRSGSTNLVLSVSAGPPTRDLRILDFGFVSGTYRFVGETGYAVIGDSVVLKARVRNDGNTAVAAFDVAFKDPAGGVICTVPVVGLAAFSETTVTATTGWAAQAGTFALSVLADSGSAITETDEANNTRTCTVVGTAAQPDLIVTGITWSPASPKNGDAVTFSATIKNQGAAAVASGESFTVLFTLDGATLAAETATLPSALTTNGTIIVQSSWTSASGTHTVTVNADSGGAVAETVEVNNTLAATLTVRQALPDLRPWYLRWGWQQISGLSFSPAQPVAGEAVTVACDIYNSGTVALAAGAPFDVVFSTDGTPFATTRVTLAAELAVGTSMRVTAVWPGGPAGAVTFGVAVDTAAEVVEEVESNNSTSAGLTICSTDAVLVAAGLITSPLQPLPGAAVTLSATVRNDGGAAGGTGATVAFYRDSVLPANKLGEVALATDVAAKGGTLTAALVWTAPVTAGNVTLWAKIGDSLVQRVMTVTANPAPNLQLFSEDISFNPALPTNGAQVVVSTTVRNTEGSAATDFQVRFYVDSTAGGWLDLGSPVPVAALAVGTSTTVSAFAPINANRSAFTVKVELVPNAGQGDASAADNTATSSFLLSDTPKADAGADAACIVGQTVALDGTASRNATAYAWTLTEQPAGSQTVLANGATDTPSLLPDLPGVYRMQLIVGDGLLQSAPDMVEITARYLTLTVASDHGTPVPGVGSHPYAWLAEVACQSPSVESVDLTRYLRIGWIGTGSVPPDGSSTKVSFTITNDSSIAWNWATNYWLVTVVEGGGQVFGGDAWFAAGSNATVTAAAAEGWRFDHWLLDGQPEGWTTNGTGWIGFDMDSVKTATCYFVELTLAECVDNHPLRWTTGGSAGWFGQTNVTSDGQDALRSGDIGDKGFSWLETTVNGTGTLSFRWKISSEYRFDGLAFMVDGYDEQVLSGEREWREVSYKLESSGQHNLRWEYYKDASLSSGDDCGWLDQVVWTPDTPPTTGFALWLADHSLSGDAAVLFGQDRNADGVPNGFEYAFGPNLPTVGPLLNIRMVNGRPVVETPAPDATAASYVDVRVLGSTNLIDWTLPVVPAADTTGKPANRAWHEPAGDMLDKAFFKLEAELK